MPLASEGDCDVYWPCRPGSEVETREGREPVKTGPSDRLSEAVEAVVVRMPVTATAPVSGTPPWPATWNRRGTFDEKRAAQTLANSTVRIRAGSSAWKVVAG